MSDKNVPYTASDEKKGKTPTNQLELEITRPLEKLDSIVETPVFVVDELFQVVAFTNGAKTILGSPHATKFRLSDCKALTPKQLAQLTDEIRGILVSEDRETQKFLRLQIDYKTGRRVFCLTFEKEALSGSRMGVRCTAEAIISKATADTTVEISKDAEDAILGWTLDSDSKSFQHFGNSSSTKMGSVTLNEWFA